MKYGLSDKIMNELQSVFCKNEAVQSVILYGSRAAGNYKNGSDIDLVIKGDAISWKDIILLYNQLEDLEYLYKFDIQNYRTITNKNLKKYIDEKGKVIYEK